MNVLAYLQQGTIGVSRLEGKLPGIPFLTLVVPKSPSNKPRSQTNLKQDFIGFESIETFLPDMVFKVILGCYSLWIFEEFIPS